jgi:deoxyribodipyrimidine photolyase-related protein
MKVFLLLPNQLFKDIKSLKSYDIVYLLEDSYYINPKFHKQKLLLHIASMNSYYDYLKQNAINVKYIKYNEVNYKKLLNKKDEIIMYNPIDKFILNQFKSFKVSYLDTPLFLSTSSELDLYKSKLKGKRITNSEFYKFQRKKLNILMKNKNDPILDKWSFDELNRNPFDKTYKEPKIKTYSNKYIDSAKFYINKHYPNSFGNFDNVYYPINHKDAELHLKHFIETKLSNFGKNQDAISKNVVYGDHSNISALLNTGLLNPRLVIDLIISYMTKYKSKNLIYSIEAIIRQIIGWREYMRFVYVYYNNDLSKFKGLANNKKIPNNWYTGKTELNILNHYIDKVKTYGYLHHIERLMIMNNLFILYEIKFTDSYNWFMRCFIDSYDWVMIPNLYMNINSLNTKFKYMTRVYIASDNYIRKMSDFKEVDDFKYINKLYWTFLKKHTNLLKDDYGIRSQINKIKD